MAFSFCPSFRTGLRGASLAGGGMSSATDLLLPDAVLAVAGALVEADREIVFGAFGGAAVESGVSLYSPVVMSVNWHLMPSFE
jgi:hypothetical protein